MEEKGEQQLPRSDLRRVKGKRCAERKFVQSVLFSRGGAEGGGGKDEEDVEGYTDEDWCNSTKKRQEKTPKGSKNQNSKALSIPKKINGTTKAKKKLNNSGAKKSLWKRPQSEPVFHKQTTNSSPTLSSKTKMTAEEHSCCAEKPLYPIFLARSVNKRNQGITVMKKDHSFKPIHVFEADKDDTSSLDWRNLMFYEGSSPDFNPGQVYSSVTFKQSASSLQFDDFAICYPSTSSTYSDRMSLNQCPYKLIEENGNERLDSLNQVLPSCKEADLKFNCFHQGNRDMPESSLWTDKYQPKKATELCGNGESVKFISDWLCLWHKKGSHTSSSFENHKTVNDTEGSCSLSNDDSESIHGETSLKNVLLVTGPVGSGKSAAIYACAQEQGFQIIEVNTSDLRTGALVKKRFGEALESHLLQLKPDSTMHSEMKFPMKSTPGITNLDSESKSNFVELMPLSDGEDFQQPYQYSCRSIGRQNIDGLKSLIFFEDVDATLSEDHGLFSTIKQLAQTAKRPMILSANKYNFGLPHNLDRLEVQFRMPPLEELNTLGYMICAAENAQVDACLIDRMVEYCQGDIRQTIMNLQFWCQRQNSLNGNKLKATFSPFLFDLEAGHQLLPKLISWSCPSQLSEFIEEELNKSLGMMEESNNLVEMVIVEETKRRKRRNSSRMCSIRSNWVHDTKEEEMLNLNSSLQVEDELLCQSQSTPQCSDTSSSPIGFSRRNIRKRFGAVVFSDSDEDHFHDGTPFFGSGLDTNCGILGVESNYPSPSFATESCCLPDEQLSPSDGYKLERISIKCSGTSVSPPDVNSMHNLAEVSSVPESSAISETETISEKGLFSVTVSWSPSVCLEDVDSMRSYLPPSLSPIEHEKLLNPVHEDSCTSCSYSDSDKATLYGELIGDSHIVHGEDVQRVCQEFDEYSSCAFAGAVKNFEKPRSHYQFNNVEETWQRLRHMDLKHHVTPEQKDASHCLNLAFGMADSISDADLLLSYCQPHLYDLLESSAPHHEETHSYSWYDDQLQMSSTISQHAMCFYAKETAALGLNGSCCDKVDLALEMLLSSANTMSLGKLLTLDKNILRSKDLRTPINSTSLERSKDESSFCKVIQSLVPQSAYLMLQGNPFHEYLSSLSQISRSETSQSSPSKCLSKRKRRRRQTTENYLSSGTYSLSPEDISLLKQCNSYRKEVN